jgi:tetrapyrrole methylase family protein / MazG family protein
MDEPIQATVDDFGILAALIQGMQADLFGGEPQLIDAGSLVDVVDAQPFAEGLPYFSANRPLIVARIDSTLIASKVRIALSEYFPSDHPIRLFRDAAPSQGIELASIPLHELGKRPIDQPTYALVLPIETLDQSRSPLGLHALVAALRSPNGCPWDREQTHASIRSAVIEEAYEVAEAIDEGDPIHLAEELGDLALQVALHAQIALEAGEFTPADVYGHINRKLVRRHPHVFGDATADTPDAVLKTWESVKAKEREASGKTEKPKDAFDRLPRSMPVLTRVASVLEKKQPILISNEAAKDVLGDQLLDAVERLVASGCNPEAALEQAYRRRAAANPVSN